MGRVRRLVAGASSLVPAELFNRLVFKAPLTILTYHGVISRPLPFPDWCFLDTTTFEAHVNWLSENVSVRPLTEAADKLFRGTLAEPTVVITFDDGFLNNYSNAFPILRRRAVPSTIFLTTDLIGTDQTLWFCRLLLALAGANNGTTLTWGSRQFTLDSAESRRLASVSLQRAIKAESGHDPSGAVAEIEMALGTNGASAVSRESPFAMLDTAAIAEMCSSGLVEFGAHSRSHPILSSLTDAQLGEQIEGSVRRVTELTGQPCVTFAYPNGRPDDYDDRAIDILQNIGVAAAVTGDDGPNLSNADPWRLRRYGIGTEVSVGEIRLTVNNFHPGGLGNIRLRRNGPTDG